MFSIPDKLVTSLIQKRCIIFVGAGLSINSGLPGWPQLLRCLSVDCDDTSICDEIEKDILSGNLLGAAMLIRPLRKNKSSKRVEGQYAQTIWAKRVAVQGVVRVVASPVATDIPRYDKLW